jgi:hypothetical protein
MSESSAPSFSPLERLDVALAERLARQADIADLTASEVLSPGFLHQDDRGDARWIADTLSMRGFLVPADDVFRLLQGQASRFEVGHQEHSLIIGLSRVLRCLRERCRLGRPPDGWFLVELFRLLTREVPRFRNNEIRRDVPWDAILYVCYPGPGEVRFLLDSFDVPHHYRDVPPLFDRLHPVRRSFRVLWRFARIAPFPDFNLLMATLAMNSYLLSEGYPMLWPRPGDRELITRLVSGPPPGKVPAFERRLLESL